MIDNIPDSHSQKELRDYWTNMMLNYRLLQDIFDDDADEAEKQELADFDRHIQQFRSLVSRLGTKLERNNSLKK